MASSSPFNKAKATKQVAQVGETDVGVCVPLQYRLQDSLTAGHLSSNFNMASCDLKTIARSQG